VGIDATAELAAVPERVYAILSDPLQDPRWRSNVVSVELVAGAGGEMGARYRERVRVAGRDIDVEMTIAALHPLRRIGFEIGAPITGRASYEVEPTATGSLVVFRLSMGGQGAIAAMREKLVGAAIAHGAERDFAELGRILTTG
jgi:uncharacterized protein YndB with AHSA1/START domain